MSLQVLEVMLGLNILSSLAAVVTGLLVYFRMGGSAQRIEDLHVKHKELRVFNSRGPVK